MAGHSAVWKREDIVRGYLDGVRRAIPLAEHQIDVMLTLIDRALPKVKSFLDIGCGDGVLGKAILKKYPRAKGVFVDFSDEMIRSARKKIPPCNKDLVFILEDFSMPSWLNPVSAHGRFDVVVSGFAIHHLTDARKKVIYKEIFDLLSPGGLFLNTEHVASASKWLENVFDEYFIDSIYEYHRARDPEEKRARVAREYYRSPGGSTDILAPVDEQCSWLRDMGFIEVDCYLKIFELALFGGIKPR